MSDIVTASGLALAASNGRVGQPILYGTGEEVDASSKHINELSFNPEAFTIKLSEPWSSHRMEFIDMGEEIEENFLANVV